MHKLVFYLGKDISKRILFFLFGIFSVVHIFAQTTIVSGTITDAQTSEALPYVNIVVKNATIGTMTDTLGYYHLKSNLPYDTLSFSAVGYFPVEKVIDHGKTQTVSVKLKPYKVDLSQIDVKMDEGPIRRLLKNVVENKPQNNPDKYSKFSYNKYTKWYYQVDNVGDKLINSPLFQKNQQIFKKDADSSKYLPLYFSEQLVFNQVQKDPPKQKSTVIADKTVGVGLLDEMEISGYTSALDMEVNFYDNFINLFSQNFVSPIANNGWFYYDYFLVDSTMVRGAKQYLVNYRPKRKGENTFKGYFIVEDHHYSLVEVDGDLSPTSELNFLKDLHLKNNYTYVNDTTPFYQRVQMDALFDYVPFKSATNRKERLSLYYSQAATISNITINPPGEIELTTPNAKYETIKLPGYDAKDSLFWSKNRMDEITEREQTGMKSIDSTMNVKSIRFGNNLGQMSLTSYYDLGKFEIGPFTNFFNTNMVEGVHLFFGGRTSAEISKNWILWGGLGYGILNQKFNTAFGLGYKFPTIYRHVFKIGYDDKMIRMGENEKILNLYENNFSATENNIVSQVLKHDDLDEIYREQMVNANYEWEWYPGLSGKLNASYTTHYSPKYYPFMQNGLPLSSISAFELKTDFRWSKNEKVIDKGFLRLYMGTEYPIVHLTLGVGNVFYNNQLNPFGRLAVTAKQHLNLGQTRFDYAVEAGMFLGKLPYTMLDIPRGNETAGYYEYDFNMLGYLEYVHDKYLHVYSAYHLNGFFFRRIPVLAKASLREVLSAKLMLGSINDKHQELLDYPTSISKMQNPYLELGAGVENILSCIQVQAVWRVTPLSVLGLPMFGFRAKIEFGL